MNSKVNHYFLLKLGNLYFWRWIRSSSFNFWSYFIHSNSCSIEG